MREMSGDSLATVDQGGDKTISAVHPDILRAHILTRLDGPTLASAGCATVQLHALSTDENLWRQICNETWPSTADPRVRHLISSFPAGHRSFYSDCFPALDHRRRPPRNRRSSPPPTSLLSAVDIRYQNRLILSKVHETGSGPWSPYRDELLGPKETVPMPVDLDFRDDSCWSDLEKNLKISWIVSDPTLNRAINLSSSRPVWVDRIWLTGEIELRYVTIFSGDKTSELVQCEVMVTCGGTEGGGGLHVREVSWHMEDTDGTTLCWEDSLVILQEAMEGGIRRRENGREEVERYEEFLVLKRERRDRKWKKERRLELVCIASSVAIFLAFWVLLVVKLLKLIGLC